MNFLAALSLLVAVIVTINAAPLTPDELKSIFKSLPSYSVDPTTGQETIKFEDFETFLIAIGEQHTPEQLQIYKKFIEISYGGILRWERVSALYAALNDPAIFAKELATSADKDNNGKIDKDELALAMDVLRVHNPELNLTYDQVLATADLDKSGDIDINELAAWIHKQLTN